MILMEEFRTFLREELIRRCRDNPRYSLRAFARNLKMEPSLLSKLLRGQRKMTRPMFERLSQQLGLGPAEIHGFVVDRSGETTQVNYSQLAEDQFRIISDWYHYAILELSKLKGFDRNPIFISRRLGINVQEAAVAIERLERLGMLFGETPVSHTTVGLNTAPAFRNLQRQVLEKAVTAMETVPFSQRDQSSMTMAANSRRLEKAKQRIKKFRRELAEYLQSGGDLDTVYNLSISLYPVTKS